MLRDDCLFSCCFYQGSGLTFFFSFDCLFLSRIKFLGGLFGSSSLGSFFLG
jgi:hypothetical protein